MRNLTVRLLALTLCVTLLLSCGAAALADDHPTFTATILTAIADAGGYSESDWNESDMNRALFVTMAVLDFCTNVDANVGAKWDYTTHPAYFGMVSDLPMCAVAFGNDYYIMIGFKVGDSYTIMYDVVEDAVETSIEYAMKDTCDTPVSTLDAAVVTQVLTTVSDVLSE